MQVGFSLTSAPGCSHTTLLGDRREIMDGRDVRAVSSLYGGFWSFDFTDHCYMTNPYFPPDAFMDGLGDRLKVLVKAYPSTNRHISAMIASPLGLTSDELVVAKQFAVVGSEDH